MQAKIAELAAKFCKTDINQLKKELSDHDLQDKFDKHAIKCLERWEQLVSQTGSPVNLSIVEDN